MTGIKLDYELSSSSRRDEDGETSGSFARGREPRTGRARKTEEDIGRRVRLTWLWRRLRAFEVQHKCNWSMDISE